VRTIVEVRSEPVNLGLVPAMPPPSPGEFRRLLQASRRGENLVAAAFAVAVILLALGAWAVWRSGDRHRRLADEALQDQASYMAGMVAVHVQSQAQLTARTLLRAWNETLAAGPPWPTTDSIHRRARQEAIGPDLIDIVPTRFFAGDDSGWRTTEATSRPADPVLATLARRGQDSLPPLGDFRMLAIPADRDTSLAFVMAATIPRSGLRWYGFEIPIGEFRTKIVQPRITAMAYSFKWLRDSLGQNRSAADSLPPLAISLQSNDHKLLYSTPVTPHSPWIGSRSIGGGLASMVTLSVEPAAVPILMQGGYPANPVAPIAATFAAGVLVLLLVARLAWRTLALSRQRDEFTSSISHELRTPLTNIQLFAETLLLDRARTVDEQRSALETITRETRRLVHMVENVLAFSRVGRPALALVRRPERVDQLIRDVLASFDPLLRSHEISVELTFEGSETADVDGDAVRRILLNLLDNAVRYGPEGQTLRITAVNRQSSLELTVEDEGPGVPASDRERVWEPFERGSTTVDTGTGIGLAVVRQLVKLHGGNACITDGRRGARFVVTLPGPQRDRAEVA
jgi:signal transduction histidine kinase